MKQSLLTASLATSLVITLGAPTGVFAGEIFRLKGESVNAFFTSTSGCIITSVSISASNNRSHNPPEQPTGGPWALVSVYQANRCEGYQTLFSGYEQKDLGDGELKIESSLATASLNTVMQVHDTINSSIFVVSVDVDWEASGFMSHANLHYIYDWPGYRSSYRSIGNYRAAQVLGLVSLGTGNPELMEGEGSIESTQSGSVSVD